jgi:hypothetical protein
LAIYWSFGAFWPFIVAIFGHCGPLLAIFSQFRLDLEPFSANHFFGWSFWAAFRHYCPFLVISKHFSANWPFIGRLLVIYWPFNPFIGHFIWEKKKIGQHLRGRTRSDAVAIPSLAWDQQISAGGGWRRSDSGRVGSRPDCPRSAPAGASRTMQGKHHEAHGQLILKRKGKKDKKTTEKGSITPESGNLAAATLS